MKDNATIVYISPQIAEQMLNDDAKVRATRNTKNRKLSNRKVDLWAKEMSAGRWELTGEAIQFNEFGELIDGQHRLYAVIQSGVTIPCYVVTGLSEKAWLVINSGKLRSSRDMLHALNYKYDAFLGYSVAHILNWYAERNFYHNRAGITTREIKDWIDTHPEIFESCHLVLGSKVSKSRQVGFKPGLLVALNYLFREKNKVQADYFIQTLINGQYQLPDDKVIMTMREKIILNAMDSKEKGKTQVDPEILAGLILSAWNAWREQKSVPHLQRLWKEVTRFSHPDII